MTSVVCIPFVNHFFKIHRRHLPSLLPSPNLALFPLSSTLFPSLLNCVVNNEKESVGEGWGGGGGDRRRRRVGREREKEGGW